jgi:hypothetical protein
VPGDSHARRTRRLLRELERARDAVARAKAERADPWQVAELEQRERELSERAVEVEDVLDREGGGPRARTRGEPWPVR